LVGLLDEKGETLAVERSDSLEGGLVEVDDLVEIVVGDIADGHVVGGGGVVQRHLAHRV
jgi:hypothetical protein